MSQGKQVITSCHFNGLSCRTDKTFNLIHILKMPELKLFLILIDLIVSENRSLLMRGNLAAWGVVLTLIW
jgi:hypothetical protein